MIVGQNDDRRIPHKEIALARARLQCNPHVREFLSKWLASGFRCPMLGQNILLDLLSDPPIWEENDETKRQIKELERTLKDGKANCPDFSDIFNGNAGADSDTANAQILDKLAEVEVYRWLRARGFNSMHKLPEANKKTVDFVGELEKTSYGIEVTRLGMPQSDQKKVKPIREAEIPVGQEGEIITK